MTDEQNTPDENAPRQTPDNAARTPASDEADGTAALAAPEKPVEAGALAPRSERPRPTVLVVHASVGSGHRSAANAIAQALEVLRDSADDAVRQGLDVPTDLEIEVLDILEFGRVVFDGDKTASLFTGATRPFYDLTWRYTLTGRLLWGGGTIWSHVNFPKFTEYVREKQPLAIICTHITAANVAVGARMLTGQRFPIVSVPTDYETEGLWPHRTTDLFCVATESMAETLRPRKVPDERILITGIPTRDAFRRTYDKRATREQLGLPQDKMIVLALAGAYLPRPYVRFRETLDKILPYLHKYHSMHFVFVAGEDREYKARIERQCRELGLENATVLGYVSEMAALMAASDLVICKSGGLTVTECLCAQVPMVLLGRAYGQEKANVLMLTSVGAAMHVTTWRELLGTLQHIASNPQSTQAMLINGAIIRRPEAALDIARASLRLSEKAKAGELARFRKHVFWFYWGKKPAHIR